MTVSDIVFNKELSERDIRWISELIAEVSRRYRVFGKLHYTYSEYQFPFHLSDTLKSCGFIVTEGFATDGNGNKTPVVTVELNPNHYETQDAPKATPSL